MMAGLVEKIFVTGAGGAAMQAVETVTAIRHEGLQGDRYREKTGYWTQVDECQVTLIDADALETIERETGVKVMDGQHRRNLVTRGIDLDQLAGCLFRVGEVVMVFDRPRPPCGYIAALTEPGMTRALMGRGGICAGVVRGGIIRVQDPIAILSPEEESALADC